MDAQQIKQGLLAEHPKFTLAFIASSAKLSRSLISNTIHRRCDSKPAAVVISKALNKEVKDVFPDKPQYWQIDTTPEAHNLINDRLSA